MITQIALEPGMALTLDGIAKGSVVDGAVAALQKQGYVDVLVEAGGDLLGNGRSAGQYSLAYRHPPSPPGGQLDHHVACFLPGRGNLWRLHEHIYGRFQPSPHPRPAHRTIPRAQRQRNCAGSRCRNGRRTEHGVDGDWPRGGDGFGGTANGR